MVPSWPADRSAGSASTRCRPTPSSPALLTGLALFLHSATNRIESDEPFHTPTWWTVALVVLATAPIVFRRRYPVWSLAFVLGGQLACEGWHVFGPSWLAVLVGVYSLGAHTEGRRRTYACAGALRGRPRRRHARHRRR